MTTIRYFLPEDGDVEAAPNVFLGPTPARPGYPPLLGQIRNGFPLPGRYHFRFKTALVPGADRDRNPAAAWLDCVDDAEPVPLWQGAIVAKVTRLGPDPGDTAPAATTDVPVPAAVEGGASASAPRSVAEASSTNSSASLLGAFDDPPLAASASGASSVHSSAGNLLDVDHPPVPAPSSGGSLLDLDHHRGGGAAAPRTDHHDLLNMAAPAPVPGPGPAARAPMAPMQGQMPMPYSPQGQGQYAVQQPVMGKQPQRPPNNLSMKGLHDPLGGLI